MDKWSVIKEKSFNSREIIVLLLTFIERFKNK